MSSLCITGSCPLLHAFYMLIIFFETTDPIETKFGTLYECSLDGHKIYVGFFFDPKCTHTQTRGPKVPEMIFFVFVCELFIFLPTLMIFFL